MRADHVVIGALALTLMNPVRGEPVPSSIQTCRSQVDEQQRLRCYDSAVDSATRVMTDQPARAVPPAARRSANPATVAVAAPTAAPSAPPVYSAPRSSAAAPATESPMFAAKIAELSFRPSGAVNVTLDNGQIWSQYGPQGRIPLRTGDSVSIRPGLFGASLLVGPSGWITKVHRIPGSTADGNGKRSDEIQQERQQQ